MAQFSMFMIFESLNQEERECQLNNPIAIIQPDAIPGNFSFVIAFNIFDLTPQRENVLSIAFISPTGVRTEMMHERNVKLPIDDEESALPADRKHAVSMNLDVRNFLFREEGIYTFSVVLNGNEYEHSFPVYKKGVN